MVVVRIHPTRVSATICLSRRCRTIAYTANPDGRERQGRKSSTPGALLLGSLGNPLDLVSFVPRLTIGALVSTIEEDVVGLAQSDIERFAMILSDEGLGREEKQEQLLLGIEERVAGFVEKGIEKENDVVDTLKQTVPEDIRESLPEQVKELLFERRRGLVNDSAPNGRGVALETWTLSEEDVMSYGIVETEGGFQEEEEYVPSPEATARGQATAELMDIQSSVKVLKENVAALQSNTDESKNGMLMLNVREARESLSQRIEQCQMSSHALGNPDIAAALVEAKELLLDVNSIV